MSESKATPGPWTAGLSPDGTPAVLPPGSGRPHPEGGVYLPVPICRMGEGCRDPEEVAANARRIVECVNNHDALAAENERLKAQLERAAARNAALAKHLRQLLADTAAGVFACSGSEERAARAALAANEEAP